MPRRWGKTKKSLLSRKGKRAEGKKEMTCWGGERTRLPVEEKGGGKISRWRKKYQLHNGEMTGNPIKKKKNRDRGRDENKKKGGGTASRSNAWRENGKPGPDVEIIVGALKKGKGATSCVVLSRKGENASGAKGSWDWDRRREKENTDSATIVTTIDRKRDEKMCRCEKMSPRPIPFESLWRPSAMGKEDEVSPAK